VLNTVIVSYCIHIRLQRERARSSHKNVMAVARAVFVFIACFLHA